MPKKLNLKNKKYGKLTVLEEIGYKNKSPLWKCQCDCGEICNFTTKELQNQNRIMCDKCKGIDITNKRFGKLIALKPTDERKRGSVVWECQCDCGNIHYATLTLLKEGKVQSCGCSRKECGEKNTIDLTGKQFGKLTVIQKAKEKKYNSVAWECKCECGNLIIVAGHSLKRGSTQSCGCLKSQGEEKIIKLLQEMNINYEYQKKFETCKLKKCLSFDFYLPDYNILIEYDGKQHFEPVEYLGGQKRFEEQQQRDNFKNNWCKENNILLIRIPYYDKDKINIQYFNDIIENIHVRLDK